MSIFGQKLLFLTTLQQLPQFHRFACMKACTGTLVNALPAALAVSKSVHTHVGKIGLGTRRLKMKESLLDFDAWQE